MVKIRDLGLEYVFKRYYSVYRAEVVENKDPKKRGRIKVRVPALFGKKTIPIFVTPKDFRNSGPNKGEFYPPTVGDWVFVEFEGGNQDYPIYSGGWHAEDELSPEFAHIDDVPQVRGFRDASGLGYTFDGTPGKEKLILSSKGHFFILDDTVDSEGIFLIHKTGAQIQTDVDGNIKILGADGSFIFVNSESGAVTVTAKDGAYITASSEGITASDSTGASVQTISEASIQNITGGDFIINSKSFGVTAGNVDIRDPLKAGINISQGKVAIGSPVAELLDLVDQLIDAFVQAPTLVSTGTGPSSPITPPTSIKLTLIKTLLTTIKGTL